MTDMATPLAQPGILAPQGSCGCSLAFRIALDADPRDAMLRLADGFEPGWGVVGFGTPLVAALNARVPELRPFPALSGPGFAVPSTQQALWMILRAADRGTLFEHSRAVTALLEGGFVLADALDTFLYREGRDLTGYVDGTENPKGEDAVAAALVAAGPGLAGSSFAAVQRWRHDLRHFAAHAPEERDAMIGRRRDSDEEIEDAPASAHVKRTAQESFAPPAFMLRRSMPWADGAGQGLEFIAYGASPDAFERSLRRMTGQDDGIADALFRFSRPVTGGYYWCPPVAKGRLDLTALRR